MNPIITIGFPVYNVERFVERSLLSAIEQNFDYPYEVLVIDDCGADNSMTIVHNIASSHPHGDRIRIIKHSENKGLGEASNTIIDNAYGEWLIFLDSDDRLTQDCLTLLYKKATEVNADFVIGNTQMIDETNHEILNHGPYINQTIRHESAAAFTLTRKIDFIGHERWNKLYNIHFLRNNHIRCVNRIMEDLYWGFTAYVYSNCISTISQTTYLYNNSPRESIMATIQNNACRLLPKNVLDTYVSVIHKMQEKIKNDFVDKPYVYDMYFYIIEAIYITLKNTSAENLDYVAKMTRGFATIVPGVKSVHEKYNRFFYVMAKKNNASILDYIELRKKANHWPWRALKWALSKIY